MGKRSIVLTQRLINFKPIVIIKSFLLVCLAAFLVIWLNLSWRPDLSELPPDSGFYAYIGKAILHGQIPYSDLWDNKPPLGYYLNAFAQLIFGQTSWGVWWSSVVWILGCTVLFFLVIKKIFGGTTAWVTSAIFLVAMLNPEIFQGGNLMEIYGLAPQIGIIGITYLYFNKHQKSWLVLLVGVLTACAFLIKQTTIILGGTSVLIMSISSLSTGKIRDVFKIALEFLLGLAGMIAIASVYWIWIGAFGLYWDAAISQGVSLSGTQGDLITNFFYTMAKVLPNLLIGRLYLIAIFSSLVFLLEKLYQCWVRPILNEGLAWIDWCLLAIFILFPLVFKLLWHSQSFSKLWMISIFSIGLYFLVKFHRLQSKPILRQVFSPTEWTWLMAVVALPLEVLLVSLGRRNYGHYFITILPATIMTIAYPIWKVISALRNSLKSKSALVLYAAYSILVISTLAWGVISFIQEAPSTTYRNDLVGIFIGRFQLNDLEQYIVQSTKPTDKVLVWHIHLGINFVTNRSVPARYLYPLNLFIPPNDQNTKLEEYVNDLENQPPELIVVQKVSSLGLPFVDTPIDQLCKPICTPDFEQALKVPQIRQQWLRFQQFFDTHYALDRSIYDWNIYRKLP